MYHTLFNNWRVFPRLGMAYMAYMFYMFHMWFTGDNTHSILEMSEWHILGYASVVGVYVGLWKFYFQTGGDRSNVT